MTAAVSVEKLSKMYRVNLAEGNGGPRDFRETLAHMVRAPLHRLRHGASHSVQTEDFWALDDVSFEINQGEALGIIGRNGAGKSTLLKILSRITEPTKGRAVIRGRVSSLLEVGTGFHPELSGRENVFLNGSILGMSRRDIRAKFDEIVAFSGVEQFLDTPVKRYSSGMRVRLAFSVAAHLQSDVLVIDEVLAVGDAEFQRKCLSQMDDAAHSGRTVLFVSHNMSALQKLCDRAIWLEKGRVVAAGNANEVVSEYLSTAAMNANSNVLVWDDAATAPGTDEFRLRRVCVESSDGTPVEQINMRTPLSVSVELQNNLEGAKLDLAIHVITADEIIAFASSSVHMNVDWGEFPRGDVEAKCSIPGNLLNHGLHHIKVFILNHGKVRYTHSELLSFAVHDNPDTRGAWFGKRPGAVQPILEWEVSSTSQTTVSKC